MARAAGTGSNFFLFSFFNQNPDFINNHQNALSDQELFLLISLSMDNHNAIQFQHLTHGEDKAAGTPPQARGAARFLVLLMVLISAVLDVLIVPVNTLREWITGLGNPAAEPFDELTLPAAGLSLHRYLTRTRMSY